jgi:hypothetical protein
VIGLRNCMNCMIPVRAKLCNPCVSMLNAMSDEEFAQHVVANGWKSESEAKEWLKERTAKQEGGGDE